MKLFKIPFDDSDSAPDKITEQLKDNSLNEEGVLPVFDIENIKKEEIEEKFFSALEQTDKIVSVSNNHAITILLISSFLKKYSNAGIIVFDAHPDCENDTDLLQSIIKTGIKKENIILIGIRNWKNEEFGFLKNNKIRFFEMKKIIELGKKEAIETIMETARNFEALYVSIDIDVLDPCFAPAVNVYEPGGLSSRDLFFFLNRLKKLKNLKALDITELKPEKDTNNLTAKLAAKIIREMY